MWEEFNKIWTDENITKSIIDARGITSDFCSWFLFYLQQAVAKTYLQCDSTALVNDLDLSDAEQESVAYIAGAVLKNVGSKLCELKWKIASNGQDVATVDKDITILNACKETRSDGLGSTSTSTKLIEALSRGGLIYPKASIINMFLVIEGILGKKIILVQNKFVRILYYLSHWGMYQFKIISLMQLHMKLLNMHEQKFKMLEKFLNFYLKVRCYVHAKYVIENYRVDTKTERKKKALRKKLKLSEDGN
ncbi:Hypothetical predicted protein [Paramuricea clavata]|uniref:Uncharacterized protein n=1 Tax=Paramuricea clavata TaxID=317549 RepID=A0A7D9K054_PARCT|nr:Hypothetical predicted protein [Paramuricea clavata]